MEFCETKIIIRPEGRGVELSLLELGSDKKKMEMEPSGAGDYDFCSTTKKNSFTGQKTDVLLLIFFFYFISFFV